MTAPEVTYTYDCTLRRVVDGDTLDLRIDLGFRMFAELRVRLDGVDTPEIRGPERPYGLDATSFVLDWLTEAGELRVRTKKRTGKYGRWIADLWRDEDLVSLVEAIITASHGRPVNY